MVRDLRGRKPDSPYSLQHKTTITTFTPEIASFITQRTEYTGGAHERTFMNATTYGLKNGKATKLKWGDVALASGREAVRAKLLEQLMLKKRSIDASAQPPELTDAMLDRFAISTGGIAWVFGQGEIGAESEGTFIAKLPWTSLAEIYAKQGPLATYLNRQTIFSDWEMVEFQGMDDSVRKLPKGRYTLRIDLDGKVSGQVDVNRFSGSATIKESAFEVGSISATRAMPPPNSYHDRFLRDLADVRSATLKGDELYLALKMDGGIMRFRRH